MANTSRRMGNALEYMVCQSLSLKKARPLDQATREKMAKLRADYSSICERHKTYNLKLEQLMQVYDKLGIRFGGGGGRDCKYQLTTDAAGCSGDVADVVLHTPDKVYRFSVKNNNMSIKHQRANALPRQLGLRKPAKDKFMEEYATINDKWVERWRAAGAERFQEVAAAEKGKLYREVNELTCRWLRKRPNYLRTYVRFLLGDKAQTQDMHMLRWDAVKQTIDLEATNSPQAYADVVPMKAELDEDSSSYINIVCEGGTVVRLRLHTASSRITDSLSLKYDTTVSQSKGKQRIKA